MPRRTSHSEASASGRPPQTTASSLAAAGVRPSKSRGQNFLVAHGVADRIVAEAEITGDDDVIEIGPGLGILTDRIVAMSPRRFVAIELDDRLAAALVEKFHDTPHVEIINADLLKLNLDPVFASGNSIVIGNLPFNVASAILRRLAEHSRAISRMVLMFQKEVADRIRARPGDSAYSALSVYTALYWTIDRHFTVAAGSFHPRPKVDAEVLTMRPLEVRMFDDREERAVLATVRASFAAPRKTIRNSIQLGLAMDAHRISLALDTANINPGARAEQLEPHRFVALARAFGRDLISASEGEHDA
jgi:16S rRNA (adenine1518-N6/adenine1519-N6)-dimethyltransferase